MLYSYQFIAGESCLTRASPAPHSTIMKGDGVSGARHLLVGVRGTMRPAVELAINHIARGTSLIHACFDFAFRVIPVSAGIANAILYIH